MNHKFFSRTVLAGSLLLSLLFNSLYSQEQEISELDFLKPSKHNVGWLKYSDASNFLYHHLSEQVFTLMDQREKEVAEIKSLPGWQKRQNYVKQTLAKITGPFPEKTALNARVLRIVEQEGYRIEHVIYESRPKFFVTASLYIPDGLKRKQAPAVIYCSGHYYNGYRSDAYQHIIINLVKKNFIVLAFDPVGQGERIEYFDSETGEPHFGIRSTHQHSYPGAQVLINGSSQASYAIWDGIRSVDYLLTRKEVDPSRIGITGRSGGGPQSAMIAAMDERIYAAAPEAFITSQRRLFESIGPQDAEQNLYHGVFHRLDHADLFLVRAPKPALLIATTNDFFSMQGARETAKEVKGIYGAFNSPDAFGMAEDYGVHASTAKNREAMYAFFQKHLNNPGSSTDEEVIIPEAEDLRVTPTGQVNTSFITETVYSLNSMYADRLHNEMNETGKELETRINDAVSFAREISGYQEPKKIEKPVYAGQIIREGYRIERYFLQGEGDYVIPYLLMIPEKPNSKVLLYLHPEGKSAEAMHGGEMEWFVQNGFSVMAPDLIGLGETGPGTFRGDAYIEGVSFNLVFAANLIGRSILGIRAGDVARLVRVLKETYEYKEIHALAKAELSPVLLHAAAFEPEIASVALTEPLSSYHFLVTSQYYSTAYIHSIVPGSHLFYDLPDLAAAIAPRRLFILNSVDANGKKISKEESENVYSLFRKSYQGSFKPESFQLMTGISSVEFFGEWIKQ